MAAFRVFDIGDDRFMVEKSREQIDIYKSADAMVDIIKSGAYSSARITLALQQLAETVGKSGESSAQMFDRAYGRGEMSRVPRSGEIMSALRELAALEKMSRVDPFSGRVVKALPPASDGFRFTIDTLTGPPKVTPRRMDDTPRVLGPDNGGAMPTFQEIAMQIARNDPTRYIGADGKPNSLALTRAMAERSGQEALAREHQRSLAVNGM